MYCNSALPLSGHVHPSTSAAPCQFSPPPGERAEALFLSGFYPVQPLPAPEGEGVSGFAGAPRGEIHDRLVIEAHVVEGHPLRAEGVRVIQLHDDLGPDVPARQDLVAAADVPGIDLMDDDGSGALHAGHLAAHGHLSTHVFLFGFWPPKASSTRLILNARAK